MRASGSGVEAWRWSSGFGAWGLGLRVYVVELAFRFSAWGFEFRVWGAGLRVVGSSVRA